MRLSGALLALACTFTAGCKSCNHDSAKGAPSASASAVVIAPSMASSMAAPTLREIDSTRGFGLPGSCRIELPIRSAPLPKPEARFVAASGSLDTLLLAQGTDDTVSGSGLVTLLTGRVAPAPWTDLDAPPVVAEGPKGWVYAWTQGEDGGVGQAALWSDGKASAGPNGDHLEVTDLQCTKDGCALLTSLARAAEAPGATVSFSHGASGSVDIATEGAFRPFAIVDTEPKAGRARIALTDGSQVALYGIEAGEAKHLADVPTPNGVYDVTHGKAPLVVAPGAAETAPCVEGGFPVEIRTPGGATETVATNAPPDGVIARALGGGAIIAWIGPASCRFATQRVVHAVVVDAAGKPLSSAMAVAEASGFALAANGDRLSLWLAKGDQLVWIRARCPASSPVGSPSSRPPG